MALNRLAGHSAEGKRFFLVLHLLNVRSTVEKYQFTLTPTSLSQEGSETILTAKLFGDFPGSPLSMRFHFVLHEGKISKLDIRG